MEDQRQKFNKKKYIAIVLMAVAVLMLCMNWIKLGSETRKLVEEAYEELEEDMERAMEYIDADDLEEVLDEEGYSSKEAKKIVKAVDAIYDVLEKAEKGKFSVFSCVGIFSDLGAMKPAFADEDLMGSDEEVLVALTVIQVVLAVVIAVFVVNGALMLFAIICYVKEKKAYGVISTILSALMFVGFGAIMFLIKIGSEDMGTGITFAPVLTVILSAASCIVWRKARKMLEATN